MIINDNSVKECAILAQRLRNSFINSLPFDNSVNYITHTKLWKNDPTDKNTYVCLKESFHLVDIKQTNYKGDE